MANDERPREATDEARRRRLTTIFGWLAGGALGLLLDYALYLHYGEALPIGPTTFVTFLVGAFGGMLLADRLGPRGFRPLGLAAGALVVTFAWIVLASLLSR